MLYNSSYDCPLKSILSCSIIGCMSSGVNSFLISDIFNKICAANKRQQLIK